MDTSAQDMIIQFLPAAVLGWIWMIPIYKTCRKRRVNPWPWVVLCAIPLVSEITVTVFWITTVMDILDRLNGQQPESAKVDPV
jgi:hypothetical protein